LRVKSTRGATQVREALQEKLAMRGIVQPTRRAARMRQWDVGDAILRAGAADRGLEWGLAPEPFDREAAQKKDHSRSKKRELFIQPGAAERDLRRRRASIAATGR